MLIIILKHFFPIVLFSVFNKFLSVENNVLRYSILEILLEIGFVSVFGFVMCQLRRVKLHFLPSETADIYIYGTPFLQIRSLLFVG